MNWLVAIFLLSLAAAAQAGEVMIVETESEIIVEYTGSPVSTGNDSGIPVAAAENVDATKAEVAKMVKLSGNETVDEQQAKEALAAEKMQQIGLYEDEISHMSGKPQAEVVQKYAPGYSSQRELMRRFKDLRQSRKGSSGSNSEKRTEFDIP